MTVYVISHNGGCEGHSPPLLMIPDRERAFVVLEFLRASGDSLYELFEVPEWPKPPNKWWDTKPIELERTPE
jgi:hypothetical protein